MRSKFPLSRRDPFINSSAILPMGNDRPIFGPTYQLKVTTEYFRILTVRKIINNETVRRFPTEAYSALLNSTSTLFGSNLPATL